MPGRKSDIFFIVVALGAAAFGLMVGMPHHRNGNAGSGLKEKAMLVERLELTDLCLSATRRYARHPPWPTCTAPFQGQPHGHGALPVGDG